jgi:hypothetical protein
MSSGGHRSLSLLEGADVERMTIETPRCFSEKGQATVRALIDIPDIPHEISYQVAERNVTAEVDPFLAATLLIAMARRYTLRITRPASPRLLHAIPTIQDIFGVWDPTLHHIQVDAEARCGSPVARPLGVGCFFTGGVDSWYSLLKHRNDITHLIYVHGFDVRLDDRSLRTTVSSMIRRVAAEFDIPVLEVTTNLRAFTDPHVTWDWCHGPGLASVALLLSPLLRTVFVPATHTYAALYSLGSHPLLDPLWSTEETAIVHDGCEATRTEKVIRIAACDTALQTLRVCWRNPEGIYNCGRCEKCLRTMIALRVAGVLHKCPTFECPLDLRAVARIPVTTPGGREHIEQNLRALRARRGDDPALARALTECLSGKYYRGIWRAARNIKRSTSRLRHALRRRAAFS